MEEDSLRSRPLNSKALETSPIRRQMEQIQKAVERAQMEVDFELAHDQEIRKAIGVVEHFLRKSGRICYGGQAINANLPKKLQFYDTDYDVPDYDFFSPSPEQDAEELVLMLKKDGFTEVSERMGVHEGTTKVMVNYIPIADITYMNSEIYKKFAKGATVVAGIKYCNADILRMNMYKELSRPRGEVERWNKVYERLTLLNLAHPMEHCKNQVIHTNPIDEADRQKIMEYVIYEKRILAGAEIGFVYRNYYKQTTPNMSWLIRSGGPVVIISPDIVKDTEALVEILGKGTTSQKREGFKDYIPDRVLIRKKRKLVAYIIQEKGCHGTTEIPVNETQTLQIASMDTLIELFLIIGLLTDDRKVIGMPVLCLAQRYVELLNKIRNSRYSKFPQFTVTCIGHERSLPSLLREKVARMEKKKTQRNKTAKRTKKLERRNKQTMRNKNYGV